MYMYIYSYICEYNRYFSLSLLLVKQYTEAFLSTYYTFITTDQLITKLLYRLDHFYNDGNQPVWQATTSLLVRVLTNLK